MHQGQATSRNQRTQAQPSRWGFELKNLVILTALLYGLIFLLLSTPLFTLAFSYQPGTSFGFGREKSDIREAIKWENSIDIAKDLLALPYYWCTLVSVVLLCGLLLFLPLRIQRGRPIPRRRWWTVGFGAGLAMGILFFSFALVLLETVAHLSVLDLGDYACLVVGSPILVGLAAWGLWAWLFWRWRVSSNDEGAWSRRIFRTLFRYSLAEWLVAVPCHVFARHKNDCCGGFLTVFGLIFGLAVMLISLGPGVFFLFARRLNEKRKALGVVEDGSRAEEIGEISLASSDARDALCWALVSLAFFVLGGLVLWFAAGETTRYEGRSLHFFMVVATVVPLLNAWRHALWSAWREEAGGVAASIGLIPFSWLLLLLYVLFVSWVCERESILDLIRGAT